jgi:hypothetical protein
MTPVEIMTLVPLATLILVFGVQPGLLLGLIQVSVEDFLVAGGVGSPIALGPEVVIAGLALVTVLVLGRIGWVLARGGERGAPSAPAPEGAAH